MFAAEVHFSDSA